MSMEISDKMTKKDWQYLLNSSLNPPIYQTPEWAKFYVETNEQSKTKPKFLQVIEDGIPLGFMVYFERKKGVSEVKIYRAPVSVVREEVKRRDVFSKVRDYILEVNKKIPFIKWLPDYLFNYKSLCEHLFYVSPECRFILNLDNSIDSLFSNLNRKCRNTIRKAQKKGVEIVEGEDEEDLEMFYSLYLNTAREKNFEPKEYSYFSKLWRTFKRRDMLHLLLAKYSGEIISAALFLEYGGRVEYEMSGTDYNYTKLGSNNLILWKMIEKAKNSGCKYFDFRLVECEPKEQGGIYRFKRSFGGEFVINYIYDKFNFVWDLRKYSLNFFLSKTTYNKAVKYVKSIFFSPQNKTVR